jgi:hypothetical protein
MTIRMLQAWNGLHQQKIVTTLSGSDEASLVAAGIATYDLDGPAENVRMAQLATDAGGNVVGVVGTATQANANDLFGVSQPNKTKSWARLFGPNEFVAWSKGTEYTPALSLTNSIFRREGASLPIDSANMTQTYTNISKSGLSVDMRSGGVIGVLFYLERPNSNTQIKVFFGTSYNNAKVVTFDCASGLVAEGWNFCVIHTAEYDGSTYFPYKQTGFGWNAMISGVNTSNTNGSLANPVTDGHDFTQTLVSYVRVEVNNFKGINNPTVYLEGIYFAGAERPKLTLGFDILTSNLGIYIMPLMAKYGFKGYVAAATANANPATPQNLVTDSLESTIGTLRQRGWDVLPHSASHNSLGSMTDSQRIVAEYLQSREQLSALGVNTAVNFFATPNGSWSNRTAFELSRIGAVVQRQTSGQRNICTSLVGLANPYNVSAMSGAGTTLQANKDFVDALIKYACSGHWLTHSVRGSLTGDPDGDGTNWPTPVLDTYVYTFEQFLIYVRQKVDAGLLDVVTPSEWLRQVYVPGLYTAAQMQPRRAITPGASPWTYANTGYLPQRLDVVGGTVSLIEYSNDAATYDAVTGSQVVMPGDMVRVTYSVAPSVVIRRM